jgi:hypothetical protein
VHTCTAGQALGAPHARPLPRIRGKHPFYRKIKSADDSVTTRGGAHSGAGEQQVIDVLWATQSQLAAAVAGQLFFTGRDTVKACLALQWASGALPTWSDGWRRSPDRASGCSLRCRPRARAGRAGGLKRYVQPRHRDAGADAVGRPCFSRFALAAGGRRMYQGPCSRVCLFGLPTMGRERTTPLPRSARLRP